MVKLHSLAAHKMEDVPKHVLKEIETLAKNILSSSANQLVGKDQNIILAAFSHVFAALIRTYISDDPKEQEKAATLYAWNLINDVTRPLNMEKKDDKNN
jgi:hypothetical protein